MALDSYLAKRDFQKTREPFGKKPLRRLRPSLPIFCVQLHEASRLHYDFRLEVDGVLKSWAVPKGPSCSPKDKRLAVQVEDHPLDYATFEGTIPAGEYGGGTVMVWDLGHWLPLEDPRAGLRRGKLLCALHGHKLKGVWALVRLARDPKNWLLIKHQDKYARASCDLVARRSRSRSVLSRRSLAGIAKAATPISKKR